MVNEPTMTVDGELLAQGELGQGFGVDDSSEDITEILGQLGVDQLKQIEEFVKKGEFN